MSIIHTLPQTRILLTSSNLLTWLCELVSPAVGPEHHTTLNDHLRLNVGDTLYVSRRHAVAKVCVSSSSVFPPSHTHRADLRRWAGYVHDSRNQRRPLVCVERDRYCLLVASSCFRGLRSSSLSTLFVGDRVSPFHQVRSRQGLFGARPMD